MYFFNHFGSIDTAEFKSKLMYYARSGVDFIILDHLSMVISGSDVQNERKEIDKIMTDLASMVVNTGVGLINVVHLKRRESREAGKSLNEGGNVSLTDLRGSAALEQLSWAVIAMERDQQALDGSEDYAFLRVLKNRTWGFTGRAGRVKYVHSTGRLLHAPEEPEVPLPHDIDKELPEEKETSVLSELEEILSSI
jgi:twinkle protein